MEGHFVQTVQGHKSVNRLQLGQSIGRVVQL